MPPLEQARSYQALMDEQGWTPAELGQRIGKAAHRITERTDLLKIAPEYQQLLASGNLRPSEGNRTGPALASRSGHSCSTPIRGGACKSYGDLRTSASALVNAEAQLTLMPPDAPPPPGDEDKRLAGSFEANVERIALMLRTSIHDNQIVAVRKVSPHRAGNLADLLRPDAEGSAADRGRTAGSGDSGEFPRRLTDARLGPVSSPRPRTPPLANSAVGKITPTHGPGVRQGPALHPHPLEPTNGH